MNKSPIMLSIAAILALSVAAWVFRSRCLF